MNVLQHNVWIDDSLLTHQCHRLDAPTMLIIFAGTAGVFGGIPVFDFFKLASDIPAYKIFLRDPDALWYQNGIPGIGACTDDIVRYLKNQCRLLGAKRVVTIGNSAGGYAAILFGVLMQADEIHAFVPKTRLLNEEDFRDAKLFHLLHKRIRMDRSYLDLRKVLLQYSENSSTIHVHYPQYEANDARHALHLRGLPNVRLHRYPWEEHGLIKILKNLDALKPLVMRAVEGRQVCFRLAAMKSRLLVSVTYMNKVLFPRTLNMLVALQRRLYRV